MQAQLSSFKNVKVEVAPVDLSKIGELQSKHDFDMLVWASYFVDPEPLLWRSLAGSSASNLSGIQDPELDEALTDGRLATSDAERKAAYDTVQQRLVETVPVIFVSRVALGVIAGKDVGGLTQYGQGSPLPAELWIRR